MNPLFLIDFYKADHRRQYPQGTEFVYSNFTPRSNRLSPVDTDSVVFVGLQMYIIERLINNWNDEFFSKDKSEVITEYKKLMDASLGKGAIDTTHLEALHDLGYLPLKIKALPEGATVPIGVPVLTIVNTLPEFFWLTNYIESDISASLWKTITVATIAKEYKKLFLEYADLTGVDRSFCDIQGHDFSFRGMSGTDDAGKSGIGHLVSFIGTDSVPSIVNVNKYYDGDDVVGVSVPATEHSVMCMGLKENEIDTIDNLISNVYPTGVVSIVSDSWDFWKVITEYTLALKDKILSREVNEMGLAKVVFRPDSGDPVKIIVGDPEAEEGSPEFKGAVQCLWDVFGGTESKGFKTLNERVGLIYGDSITLDRAEKILEGLLEKGFSSGNIVFGIGSYTYQYLTRDSFGFAMKATWGQVSGEERPIFKDPITDRGDKKSLKGLLKVSKENGVYTVKDERSKDEENTGELKTVFLNSGIVERSNFSDVRKLASR